MDGASLAVDPGTASYLLVLRLYKAEVARYATQQSICVSENDTLVTGCFW